MSQTVGPFVIEDADPILARATEAVGFIPLSGAGSAIVAADAGRVRLRSVDRPASAPWWAWGLTPKPSRCWVNPKIEVREQDYACLHEWAHTLDERCLTRPVRLAIRARMGTALGWDHGDYDQHFCTVPAEGFADAFARAISGGRFKGIIPTFYRTTIKPADYAWLLDVVAEALTT